MVISISIMLSLLREWKSIVVEFNFSRYLPPPTPKDSLLYTLVEEGVEMREVHQC